ncbi:Uncharacterised protein [Bordetella pertussis]|nr:Uncharacterised protein [Bordetella pertussis]
MAPNAASACRPMQLEPGSSPTLVSLAPVMKAFMLMTGRPCPRRAS